MYGIASAERAVPQRVAIDWAAAARDAQSRLLRSSPLYASAIDTNLHSPSINSGLHSLARLGALTAPTIPNVNLAPVPVLAPIKQATADDKRQRRHPAPVALARSMEEFQLVVGQSGYDAIMTIRPKQLHNLGIKAMSPVQLHLAGSTLRYANSHPGRIVPGFKGRFANLRKSIDDDQVTYTFQRYGVPYFINAACRSGPSWDRGPSCTEVEAIVRVVLKDLRLVGGAPASGREIGSIHQSKTTRRPAPNHGPRFFYYPPGHLMPGSSEASKGGAISRVEYGKSLRFPIRLAPVYANSQVFMHGGNCLGQRIALPSAPDGRRRYRCQQTNKVLEDVEGHAENYSYPWRDTYCEVRGSGMPIGCPLKRGHAGQDLRPAKCNVGSSSKSRCRGDIFDVVAVTDGWAWWKTGVHENHLRLNADDGTDKLYYMYLHMSPRALKAAGMQRGKLVRVKKGQVIGKIGNYWKTKPGGTTTHLHFEIRRGDDIGDPLAPYWTLVRAYERLLGRKGTEITNEREPKRR
ncbi:MAG: M23 family metallopeptidase [Hyphomicrobiaceae bacterium]